MFVLSSLVCSSVSPTFSPATIVGHDEFANTGGASHLDVGSVDDHQQSPQFLYDTSIVSRSDKFLFRMVMEHQFLAMVLVSQISDLQCKVIAGVNRAIDGVYTSSIPGNRHLSCSFSPFEAEQKLQRRYSSPMLLSATHLLIFIFTEPIEYGLLRFRKVRKHSHNLADPQIFFCSEMCYNSRSLVNLQLPALVETSAFLPMVVCHHRRLPPETIVTLNLSVHSYHFVDGGGMYNLNPSSFTFKLVGSDGPNIFLSCWVKNACELVGLGLIDEYCLIKTVHFPRVSLMLLWGLFGFYFFNYLWVLKLVLGTEYSLSVVVGIVKSRFGYSHLLQRAIVFIFTLTSFPIIRSSARESPIFTPPFNRATFPGQIISDQRSYSQFEKFQTAYKRTLVEILKAVLSWSPFGKCAITCITHLDPIEEIISMRFEELSLCFSLCIVMWFMFM